VPSRERNSGAGRTGALILLLLLPLLGGLVYAHARLSAQPLWSVRAIEVSGNRSISTSELLDRLHLHPGLSWWKVRPGWAGPLLAETPRVESLRLCWRCPRDLAVKVRERESVLRVLSQPPVELAADGVVLNPEPALDAADLPLLTGVLPGSLTAGRKLEFPAVGPHWREILELSEKAPQLWKSISEIHYVGGGDFQVVLREGRRIILWQPGLNQDLKEQIPEILAQLGREHVEDAVLDLRFRDQLVVRRPESALADTAVATRSNNASPRDAKKPSPKESVLNGRHGA
jgi:cell division septal protein FtsQ